MARILIIEDERNLAEGLKFNLQLEKHDVHCVESAEEALEIYRDYDMMVLDIMLPGMNGLELLALVRQKDFQYPVLILSAKAREEDRLNGFSAGADDYVTKPFSLPELILRIKRMLERTSWYDEAARSGENVEFGDYWINFRSFEAKTNQGETRLTPYECYVMKYLIENQQRPVSRIELLEKVWGYSSALETRTVDIFIARLRKLFEKDSKIPLHIRTLRGVGYQFFP